MKKAILSAVALMGLSAVTYGQSVFFDNTSGGGLVMGAAASDQINGALMGGSSSNSLAPVVTLTGGQLLNLGGGLVYDSSGQSYVIPGVAANGTATLHVQFWVGTDPTYAAAAAAGKLVADSPIYTNPTGGGGVPASVPPSALANMPNVTLAPIGVVPEPSTLALAGLGAAALLMYRRRTA
jgi:hypothetical protein